MTLSQVRLRQGFFPWLLLVILSLLWLTRQPEWTSFTTIYIDDAIFLNQAVFGDWSTIFQSHNGYLHGIPRILALTAASLPLAWAPIVIAIGSSFVLFIGMAFTWLSLRDQPGVIGQYALVIAGTLAIVPIASIETVSNIACLQWYLVSVAIVVTALGTVTLWRGWAAALFLFTTALTTPLVIVALPGALWMFVRSARQGKVRIESALPAIGLVMGLVPQIFFLATNEGFGDTDEVPLISLTTYSTIMEMIGPMPLFGWDPNSGWPLGLSFMAIVLIAIAFVVAGAAVFMSQSTHVPRERRVFVLAVILAALASLAVVAYVFRGSIREIFSPGRSPVLSGIALTVIASACILITLSGMRLIAQGDPLLSRDRILRAVLIILPALAIIAASLIIRPSVRTLSLGNPGGTRYVLPLAFVMWIVVVVALIILINRCRVAPRNWLWVAPLVLIATVIVATSWSQSLGRPGSPTWSEALNRSCTGVPSGTIVLVPTAPVPWETSVPCP